MNREYFKKLTRRGSVYARTFGWLLGLSAAILAVVLFVIMYIVSSHYREQIAISNLDRLRLSSSSLDVTFDILSQNMTQTMWNHDFIDFMINPKQNDPDMNYRIINQLKNTVRTGELVSRAYFYSPMSDTVFQNNNYIVTKQTFSDNAVLMSYLESDIKSTPNSAGTSTRIFYHQGRIFMFQELNIASHIGTLVYELNQSVVQKKLLSTADGIGAVLVFDENYQPLFTSGSYDTNHPAWSKSDNFITYDSLRKINGETSGYYSYTSERGWHFLIPLDPASLQISWVQLLTLYLPLFLLLMTICITFSLYISKVIYHPINRLMQVVAPTWNAKSSPDSSEVDMLESAYSFAMEQHAEMSGIMDTIAPEILESMLTNLLIGKHLTQDRVAEILHGVGNPVKVQGRFFVICCQFHNESGRTVSDTELNLYLLAIRNLSQQLSTSDTRLYSIHTDKMTVGLICCFPESHTLTQLSQDANQIIQALQLHTEAMPFKLFCARGKFYPNLLDIRYSYREAVEKVKYQQYLYSTGEQPSGEILEDGGELVMDRGLIKARVNDIMLRATENAISQAKSLTERVLSEIDRQSDSLEQYRHFIAIMQDEMLERVISFPLTEEDQKRLSYRRAGSPDSFNNKEELVNAVKEDYDMMFRMVAGYSQKSRYKYIEQAKQYISENYMDSNLSLNIVGDYVGISASYLSELWNEVAGEKFSSYLAVLRVTKAQQLLTSTKLPIKEIGFRCGFNSAQNFIRVFKKYTGIPPGQFRDSV